MKSNIHSDDPKSAWNHCAYFWRVFSCNLFGRQCHVKTLPSQEFLLQIRSQDLEHCWMCASKWIQAKDVGSICMTKDIVLLSFLNSRRQKSPCQASTSNNNPYFSSAVPRPDFGDWLLSTSISMSSPEGGVLASLPGDDTSPQLLLSTFWGKKPESDFIGATETFACSIVSAIWRSSPGFTITIRYQCKLTRRERRSAAKSVTISNSVKMKTFQVELRSLCRAW